MAITSVPTLAGIASTVIFVWSVLPMLVKAHRTRDLASYSLGNLLLANVGNAVHSVYVFSLPAGPIWAAQLLPCDQRFDADLVAAVRVAPPQVYARHPQGWFARSSTTATTSTYRGTGSRDTLSQGDRLAVATNRGMPVEPPGATLTGSQQVLRSVSGAAVRLGFLVQRELDRRIRL